MSYLYGVIVPVSLYLERNPEYGKDVEIFVSRRWQNLSYHELMPDNMMFVGYTKGDIKQPSSISEIPLFIREKVDDILQYRKLTDFIPKLMDINYKII